MSYATKRKLAIRSKKSPMPTDDAVSVWIDAYQPEVVSASVWGGALHDFVVGLVRELDVGLEASKRYARVLAGLGAWSLGQGFDLDREVVLCPATVDAYMAGGLPGASNSSLLAVRGDLRSLGTSLTREAPWVQRPEPITRTSLSAPYTEVEVAAIRRDVSRQSTTLRVQVGRAIVALGLGAGLDGRWNVHVIGTDVAENDGLVTVTVGDPAERLVVVRDEFADELLDLAAQAGSGRLVAGSTSKNAAAKAAGRVVIDQGHISLSAKRLRSTWLLVHLANQISLPVLLAAAGLQSLASLSDLVPFLDDDGDPAEFLRGA
jgi:hypothetical protein